MCNLINGNTKNNFTFKIKCCDVKSVFLTHRSLFFQTNQETKKLEISDVLELVIQQLKSPTTFTDSNNFQNGVNLCVDESLSFLAAYDYFDGRSTKPLSDEIRRRVWLKYSDSLSQNELNETASTADCVLLDLSVKHCNSYVRPKEIENSSDNAWNRKQHILHKIRSKILEKRRNVHSGLLKSRQYEDEFMWRPW